MKKLAELTKRFSAEEEGAAMVEYTILIGIITVATITAIIGVGTWVGGQWGDLNTDLAAQAAAG